MERKRRQKALRQKIDFRVLVLLLSIILICLYFKNAEKNPAVWGAVLGLSGSACVWAAVEIVDFYIDTYFQYVSERNSFIMKIEVYWSKLRTAFKSSSEYNETFWLEVKELVDELYSYVCKYPFEGEIYAISNEFEKIFWYISRLYWKTDGYRYGNGNIEENEYWQPLYDTFVLAEHEEIKNVDEITDKCINIAGRYDELKNTEVKFESFLIPEDLIIYDLKGDLKEQYRVLPCLEGVYLTFKPALDFRKNILNSASKGMFCTVTELTWRKIQALK